MEIHLAEVFDAIAVTGVAVSDVAASDVYVSHFDLL